MIKQLSIAGALLLLPITTFAQPKASFGQIGSTVTTFIGFLNSTLVPLVFALAFLLFIWGMFKYFILSGASEEGRNEGKQLMLWGVIAFVMMVSIWGVVNVVSSSLGFNDKEIENIPLAPVSPT